MCMCVCVFVCVCVCVCVFECECLCVCVALEPFFLGGCAIYSCNMLTRIGRHILPVSICHVEIVSLSIRSYSLGATHCVAIYNGSQPITVHQSHEIYCWDLRSPGTYIYSGEKL